MSKIPDNIYEPPKSPLVVESEDVIPGAGELLVKLVNEQSYLRVFIVTFFGSVAGVLVLSLFLVTPGIFFLAFALPGVVTGFAVRHLGKALDRRYRLFAGAVALVSYWMLVSGLNPSSVIFGFILSFLNAIVAASMSRRSLSGAEEAAVYYRRMGIDKTFD